LAQLAHPHHEKYANFIYFTLPHKPPYHQKHKENERVKVNGHDAKSEFIFLLVDTLMTRRSLTTEKKQICTFFAIVRVTHRKREKSKSLFNISLNRRENA